MSDYRKYFDPLIKNVEGHKEDVYKDHNGNHTVGTGLNLGDHDVQNLMKIRGIDPEEVKSGTRKLASVEMDDLQNAYLGKREGLVRDKLGKDLYDILPPHKKAAVMSMGYQSLNNIGPNLTQSIAGDDPIGTIREMLLNSNKEQDPGILSRRMQEAQTFSGDPVTFSSAFKAMTYAEKQKLNDILNKAQNENVRAELMQKYGSYLSNEPEKPQFNKLFPRQASKPTE